MRDDKQAPLGLYALVLTAGVVMLGYCTLRQEQRMQAQRRAQGTLSPLPSRTPPEQQSLHEQSTPATAKEYLDYFKGWSKETLDTLTEIVLGVP